jgi:hypothetical protein
MIDFRLRMGAVAAGLGFVGLGEAVDGFHDAVGDLGVEPVYHAHATGSVI